MFIRTPFWTHSWARWIQYTSSHYVSLRSSVTVWESTPGSRKWYPPFGFFRLKCCMHSHVSHASCMPFPFHIPCFDHRNSIWRTVLTMKFLLIQFSPVPCYFLLLWSKNSPQNLFASTHYLCFFVKVEDQVSHLYEKTGKTIVYFLFTFSHRRGPVALYEFVNTWICVRGIIVIGEC
jgi:hypothetical protein